jgi:uncharacterized protein (DUF1684 family)
MKITKAPALIAAAGLAVLSMGCGGTPSKTPEPPPAATTEKAAAQASSPANSYEASVQRFQHDWETTLTSDTGWLTIAGLFFLSQPSSTFGSDPLNDIVLPASAPAHAGTFELHDKKVNVKAAPGVTFQLGNKPVTSAELKSDAQGPPDRIGLGDLQLWVHMSGDRLSIRLRDKNSRLRKEFAGLSWFPVNEAYRVEAQYVPYDKPKTIEVPNILGDIDQMTAPGLVSFTLNGEPLKMEAVNDTTAKGEKVFWFIFRDLTSGKESYPAARFIYLPLPVDGKMTLDFNMAENPPCAYNPFTTCPLPPQQNRLPVRVEAGEKAYGGHS